MRSVTAQACANIALVKYWGKRDDRRNTPATPSISLTLDGLLTTTTVSRIADDPRETPDHVELNGAQPPSEGGARIAGFLSMWRDHGLIDGAFSVESTNSFPTGSGLASSSSGFAALSMALSAFSKKKLNQVTLSRLARQGSGSAARSVPGGLVAMPATHDPSARQLVKPEEIEFGMVVAQVKTGPKAVGSTEGMNLSRATSPFYTTWVSTAHADYRAMLQAIKGNDFTVLGKLTEDNSHAMHACMLTTRPALLYMNSVSIRLLREVIHWRGHGLEVYATSDAGPHVCLLARRADLDAVAKAASEIEGVESTLISQPGPAAHIIESSE